GLRSKPGEGALRRARRLGQGPLTRRFASTSPPKGEVRVGAGGVNFLMVVALAGAAPPHPTRLRRPTFSHEGEKGRGASARGAPSPLVRGEGWGEGCAEV